MKFMVTISSVSLRVGKSSSSEEPVYFTEIIVSWNRLSSEFRQWISLPCLKMSSYRSGRTRQWLETWLEIIIEITGKKLSDPKLMQLLWTSPEPALQYATTYFQSIMIFWIWKNQHWLCWSENNVIVIFAWRVYSLFSEKTFSSRWGKAEMQLIPLSLNT